MARNAVKNLDHILISEEHIDGFTIKDTTYQILAEVPASALVALTLSADGPVVGMQNYILECIATEAQKAQFLKLVRRITVDGLSEIVNEIVEATTPFSEAKPSA